MNKGFTLVELLVVMLIIGILSSIAIPEYTRSLEKARSAEVVLNVAGFIEADRLWADEMGYTKGYQDWREIYYMPDVQTCTQDGRSCSSKFFTYTLGDEMHSGVISGGALPLATITRLGEKSYTISIHRSASGSHRVSCTATSRTSVAKEMCQSFAKNQGWATGN